MYKPEELRELNRKKEERDRLQKELEKRRREDRTFNQCVENFEKRSRSAAENGCREVNLGSNLGANVCKRLKSHFESLGFKTEIRQWTDYKMSGRTHDYSDFYVSWEE